MSDPSTLTAIAPDELRAFAGSFATGVTVLTTRGADGRLYGLTMNAVSCVCLDPPLFLACVDKGSATLGPLRDSGVFALNILADGQRDVSNTFASKGEDKFAGIAHRIGALGVPLIEGALAVAEFRLHAEFEAGDHVIVIGEAVASSVADGRPLGYFRGKYAELDG